MALSWPRRGYVVFLCDMPCQGMSEMIGHNGGYAAYNAANIEAGTTEDVTDYIIAVGEYMQNLNYVDSGN